MSKTPEMNRALDAISSTMFGRKRSECIVSSVCVDCGASVVRFRDRLSTKEFSLSGMCQICQDRTFSDFEIDCE